MIPALLVGSRNTWRDQIDPLLLAHGIEVAWWWPTISHLHDIPASCRLVVVTTDCCSHKLSKPAMDRARKAEVQLVCGPHRKSTMAQLLERAGFPRLESSIPDASVGVIDIVQAAIATMPASTIFDLPLLDAESEPEPATEPEPPAPTPEAPMLKLAPPAGVVNLSESRIVLYHKILPVLAADPWLTAAEASKKVKTTSNALFQPMTYARDALGIKASPGSGATRIVDRARYEHACKVLNVTPVAENVGPTRPPGSAALRGGGDRAQPGRKSPTVAPTLAPAPVLPAPPPPPVPAPPPTTSGVLYPETLDVLRLLLEAIHSEGITEITLKNDGSVAMQRRIVVSANVQL